MNGIRIRMTSSILALVMLAACGSQNPPTPAHSATPSATDTPTLPQERSPTRTASPVPTRRVTSAPSPTRTSQPTFTPTLPRIDPGCEAGWSRLRAGYQAVLTAGRLPNRVRSAPSTQADNIVSLLYPGEVVQVIAGPVCADGLVFWQVENDGIPGGSGWTAEGDLAEYYLEPRWVTCAAHGVNFLMPGGWGCHGEVAPAGSDYYGHAWPRHIQIRLTAYPAQSEWAPILYVYPTEALPASFLGPPIYGAPLMVRAHIEALSLGERGVSENGNIHPVFNSRLVYAYQGKTSDGKFTLFAILPVNAPFLPNSYEDPALPVDGIPFEDDAYFNWSAYYQKVQAQLDAAPETVFTPALDVLDALIESITVIGP